MKLISSSFLGLFYVSILISSASAQITTDGSTNTNLTPTDNGVRIDEGDRAGGNLFHSFGEFSVPNGSEAFFNNASDIANIFSRVTGGNISNINGLIRANGAANLFLINPAGIVFGEGARLQLGGSFYGSTADSIVFPDGEFSATDLDNPPLITINAPIGLGFRDEPQPIINDSVADNLGLQINAGETIGLIGGEIAIRGNGVTPEEGNINNITAQGAKVWLGGLAEAGTVNLDENLNPRMDDNVARANVSFSNGARVDVADAGAGEIQVIGNDITLTEASQLLGGIAEGLGTTEATAGDVTLNATGAVNLSGESRIENRVNVGATGNSGNINVTAESLSITDGSVFSASTFGTGNAGSVRLNIAGEANLTSSNIFSNVESGAVGNAGNIFVTANSLSLSDDSFFIAGTFGQGNPGSITIDVTEAVTLSNDGDILSRVGENAVTEPESSGNISINAGSLTIADGISSINTSTSGQGNAGNVKLNISGEANLIDGNIFSNVESGAEGNGGNITIEAGSLSLEDGAQLQTSVRAEDEERPGGRGNGGNISIDVEEDLLLSGIDEDGFASGILSQSQRGTVGNAGSIEINSQNLNLEDGGIISSSALGQGNAGSIQVEATESVNIEGFTIFDEDTTRTSTIETELRSIAVGDTGEIEITANSLSLSDGGEINSSTFGQGNAGNVRLNISGEANLIDGNIFSNVESGAEGNGGNITIEAGSLSLEDGAQLQTSVRAEDEERPGGRGNGGSISIDVEEDLLLSGIGEDGFASGILSQSQRGTVGNAGEIEITTGNLTLTDGGRVSASTSGTGNAGLVTINASQNVSAAGENSQGNVSGIFSNVSRNAVGNAGGIEITTAKLSLTGGGEVVTATFGNGDAGNLTVIASEYIELVGSGEEVPSGLFASSIESDGNGGDLIIATDKLIVRDEAVITVGNFQQVVGSREPLPPGTGAAGNLEINAGSVEVSNRGTITADNASGIGGELTLKADSLTLENQASVSASTTADRGQGGIITLDIDDTLIMRNSSLISARAESGANGGNINIDAEFIIAFPSNGDGNDILASAEQGQGGNITFTADSVFNMRFRRATPGNRTNDIDVSSEFPSEEFGEASFVSLGLSQPEPLATETITTSNICSVAESPEDTTNLVVRGKGGITPAPSEPFNADALITDELSNVSQTKQPVGAIPELSLQNGNNDNLEPNPNYIPPHIKPVAYEDNGEPVYIARGVIKTEDGNVILTAYPTKNNATRTPTDAANCH